MSWAQRIPSLVHGVGAPVWILAVLGAGLVLIKTSGFGVGVATDSIAYLAGAKSLLAGDGYLMYDGSPNTQWPPLYPAVLAFFGLAGLAPEAAARWVNALSFAAILVLVARWLAHHVESRALCFLGTVAVFLSIPLNGVMTFAWSEGLFAVIVLLFILQGERVLNTGSGASLVVLGVCAAAGTLTRYVGVTLVLGGIAIILLQPRELRSRIRDSVLFLAVSGTPVAAWFLRNYVVAAQLRGGWEPSPYELSELITILLDTIALWFLPPRVPYAARLTAASAVVLALLAALVVAWRRRSSERIRTQASIVPLASFLLAYAGFLIGITLDKKLDFDARMFAPAAPPLLLAILVTIDRARLRAARRFPPRLASGLATAFLAASLVFPAWHLVHAVAYAVKVGGGGGFNTQRWRESDLIGYVKGQVISRPAYTNAPGAVYLHTGQGLGATPARNLPDRPTDRMERLREFGRSMRRTDDVYLVMFTAPDLPEWYYRYSPSELGTVFSTESIATTSDGVIYRVRSRPTAVPASTGSATQ